MCKSGSKSNWSYRQNRSSRRIKEETTEESSASDDEDDYPTRLEKPRVRKTRAMFSQGFQQDQTKRCLEEFIREDIMEWCPADQAMTFVSPIYVCPKPNKPGEIRITADYQCLNKNLSRTCIVQNPKVDGYINKLSQCKYWFKLDLLHAYYQLELDEESRRLTTMSTVWGNVRMKGLLMGLLNAQDFYDERMYHLLHDIKNTANYRDDIMGEEKH